MDNPQTMPAMSAVVKETFSRREWLNYYLNIWQRNITARLIDVKSDEILKAINPETLVELDPSQPEVAVKVRLEIRKQLVKDARAIIEATQALLAKSDEELDALTSDEALKVAEDMLPIPAEKLPTEEEIAAQAELDKQSAPADEVGVPPEGSGEVPAEEAKAVVEPESDAEEVKE